MNSRKAQSATEYLMTYGWAILAISIVGGLIYSYVFLEKDCAYGAQGFPLASGVIPSSNEYSVNSDGSVSMLVLNQLDKNVTVTKINGISISGVSMDTGATGAVNAGAGTVKTGKRGKCYSVPITITYNTDKISGMKSAGTLNGMYG